MKVNYSDQKVIKGNNSLFLAGPTPRSIDIKTWRKEAIAILEQLGFDGIVYVPEKEYDDRTFDYDNQVFWEREVLHTADVIVFYIPRNLANMPAFTTNVEFGYWLAKDRGKVIYGRPKDAEKCKYLDWLYQFETGREPSDNLRDLLISAIKLVDERKIEPHHFSYELSVICDLIQAYPEICFFVGDIKVLPPRFIPDLKFVTYGQFIYGEADKRQLGEFDRTVLSLLLYHYLIDNGYEKFVECQCHSYRLTEERFTELRRVIRTVFDTPEKRDLLLYYIIIQEVVKSYRIESILIEQGIDINNRTLVIEYLLNNNLLPTMNRLSEESRQVLMNVLMKDVDLENVISGEESNLPREVLADLSQFERMLMATGALLNIGGCFGNVNNQNGALTIDQIIAFNYLDLISRLETLDSTLIREKNKC